MSDESTNQLTGPTTDDVREQAGVTVDQLHYWTRKGYLVGPRQQGRKGRGKGTVAVWPPETIPKARLIAQTARPKKGADVEIARALLLNGHAVDAELLRKVLLVYVEHWQRWLKPPRRGRPTPNDYKERTEYLRGNMGAIPRAARPYVDRIAVAVSRAAYPDRSVNNPITRAAYYLSPVAMREAVTTATPLTLEAAWKETAALDGYLTVGLPAVTEAFFTLLGLPGRSIQAAGQARIEELGGDTTAHLRLILVVFYVVACHYRNELPAAAMEAARSIPHVHTILDRLAPRVLPYLRDAGLAAPIST